MALFSMIFGTFLYSQAEFAEDTVSILNGMLTLRIVRCLQE